MVRGSNLALAASFHPWERWFTSITSVHPAVNGYLIQFREGTKGSDGEEIGTTVIYAEPREKVDLFTSPTALRLWEYLYLYLLHFKRFSFFRRPYRLKNIIQNLLVCDRIQSNYFKNSICQFEGNCTRIEGVRVLHWKTLKNPFWRLWSNVFKKRFF